MKRRDLLKGLAMAPALSMFSSALVEDKDNYKNKMGRSGPAGFLRIILNGPFTLVLDQKQPDRITFFCPIDPDKLHRFYVNKFAKPLDDGKDPKRTYHYQLPEKGLDIYSRKRPYIDRCFRDISFSTDLWKKQEYFVTLDLPIPDSIGFIPPTNPIIFKNGHEGSMPANNVLEYKMTDPDDVKVISKQGNIAPQSLKELSTEYTERCRAYAQKNAHHMACSEFEDQFREWEDRDVRTLVFGVGVEDDVPLIEKHAHAVKFYNEVILTSFPHAQEQQQLKDIGNRENYNNPSRGALVMPAVWDPSQASSLFHTVSAVMDCSVIGPHVKVTGP